MSLSEFLKTKFSLNVTLTETVKERETIKIIFEICKRQLSIQFTIVKVRHKLKCPV